MGIRPCFIFLEQPLSRSRRVLLPRLGEFVSPHVGGDRGSVSDSCITTNNNNIRWEAVWMWNPPTLLPLHFCPTKKKTFVVEVDNESIIFPDGFSWDFFPLNIVSLPLWSSFSASFFLTCYHAHWLFSVYLSRECCSLRFTQRR